MLYKPTPKAVTTIRKKYGLLKNDPLSTSQYKEACALSSAANTTKSRQFSFKYILETLTHDEVVIIIEGVHLSNNRINSLTFKQKLAYKKAFKLGADELYLLERKRLKSYPVMQKAEIDFTFYTTRSRDHDNNNETLKRVQDTIVALGLVADDKRENIIMPSPPGEVLAKNYKILVALRRIV